MQDALPQLFAEHWGAGCSWTGACSGARRNNEFELQPLPAFLTLLQSEMLQPSLGLLQEAQTPHRAWMRWDFITPGCQSHRDHFTPSPGLVWIFTFHIYITFWTDMRETTLQLSPSWCWRNNFTFTFSNVPVKFFVRSFCPFVWYQFQLSRATFQSCYFLTVLAAGRNQMEL